MQVSEEDFGRLMSLFMAACDQQGTSRDAKQSLIDFFEGKRSHMVESLMESLEQKQKFTMFIEKFFEGLARTQEAQAAGMFTSEESK